MLCTNELNTIEENEMKKFVVIFGILAVLAASAIGAGAVYAQSAVQSDTCPMAGSGYQGQGRGNRAGGQILRPYMEVAVAGGLGISLEELQAAHNEGKTAWDVAQEKGFSESEFQEMFLNARSQALTAAAAEGVITQEQADSMLAHFEQMAANGMAPGNCDGTGAGKMQHGSRMGGRGGGRWNSATQP